MEGSAVPIPGPVAVEEGCAVTIAVPAAEGLEGCDAGPQEAKCQGRARAALLELFNPKASLRKMLPCLPGKDSKGSEGNLAPLDGVRALALLWVLHQHSIGWVFGSDFPLVTDMNQELYKVIGDKWWMQLAFTGARGVDVFFVLSGLLIARNYIKPDVADTKDAGCAAQLRAFAQRYAVFITRRTFRLWPMVALAVLVNAMLAGVLPGHNGVGWAYLAFVSNLFGGKSGPESINYLNHMWSVGIEFQMYVVTPFICELVYDRQAGARRKGAYLTLGLISAMSLALRAYWAFGPADMASADVVAHWPPSAMYMNPASRLSPYISGIAVALVLHGRRAGQAPNGPRASQAACAKDYDMTLSRSSTLATAASGIDLGRSSTLAPETSSVASPASETSSVAPSGLSLRCERLGEAVSGAALDLLAITGLAAAGHFSPNFSPYAMSVLTTLEAKLLVVAIPPALGWCLARVIYRACTVEPSPKDPSLFGWLFAPWRWVQAFLSCKALQPVALLSYSAYVMQQFILEPTELLVSALGWSWEGLGPEDASLAVLRFLGGNMIYVAMCLLLAVPCHILVESPGMKLGRRAEGFVRRCFVPRQSTAGSRDMV